MFFFSIKNCENKKYVSIEISYIKFYHNYAYKVLYDFVASVITFTITVCDTLFAINL